MADVSDAKAKLRVGLLTASDQTLPIWAIRIIERIRRGTYAEVVAIVTCDEAEPTTSRNSIARVNSPLYTLWHWIDKKVGRNAEDLGERMLSDSGLADVPKFCISLRHNQAFESGTEPIAKQRAGLAAMQLDVLINVSDTEVHPRISELAKFGNWSYRFGIRAETSGESAGFWEMVEEEPLTYIELVANRNRGTPPLVLANATCVTNRTLMIRQRNAIYRCAESLLPVKLKELHENEAWPRSVHIGKNNKNKAETYQQFSRPILGAPRVAFLAVRYALRLACRKVVNFVCFRQWILLYKHGDISETTGSVATFNQIIPPADKFWADPFVVSRNGENFVFIEELPYSTQKGHIAWMQIFQDGTYTTPKPALVRPYHLSYPFIFVYQGTYYMIPESAENRSIELYRCERFPDNWIFVKNLFTNIDAVDTTLYRQADGTWWMFTTIREFENERYGSELALFSSNNPIEGSWTMHPSSPISTDICDSRQAGCVFEYAGKLYRPAQDGSYHYGYGININEIEILTASEYRESRVNEITPGWDKRINATHTLNSANGLTISDAGRLRLRAHRANASA